MAKSFTYVRVVQVKNASGEMEDHELHSNSITDLDAQYSQLLRELDAQSKDPLTRAAESADSEGLRTKLQAALVVMGSFMTTTRTEVPHTLLEALVKALTTGEDLQIPDDVPYAMYVALARAYNTATNVDKLDLDPFGGIDGIN